MALAIRHHVGVDLQFCPGPEDMVTWIASDPGFMQRASHALVVDGRTWLVDPVDHPDVRTRLDDLPPVAGVVQLLDRHGRDCVSMSASLGVPLIITPYTGIGPASLRVIVVRDGRGWRERALWWPARATLVVAEAVGTAPWFRSSPTEVIGVHPMMRITPPRVLCGFPARHVLMGHGPAVHRDDAGACVDGAVACARRTTPRWLLSCATGSVRRTARRTPMVPRR